MRPAVLSGVIAVVMVVVPAMSALAVETVDWRNETPESGEVVGDEVYVTGAGTHRLLTIESPSIGGDMYLVRGALRYEGVAGTGYLEMWSHFADGGAFFSRTLAERGTMAWLSGDSPGRVFELPFFLNGADPPIRLEINVVLPEGGEVWVGALELDGIGDSHWWSSRTAGMIGAAAGALTGVFGALVGLLVSRQVARGLVRGLLVGGLAMGASSTIAGLVALVTSQPFHVWFLLLLVGVILVVAGGTLPVVVVRRYAAAELHRMHALDTPPT